MLFYPKNFPLKLEKNLIELLLCIQSDVKKVDALTQKQLQTIIYKHLKTKHFQDIFCGSKPNNWWFTFILLRHKKEFDTGFVDKINPFLIKTKTRSLSGILPLTVFTKGKGCSFNCVYCPNEPGVPKSYFSDEPAVMRAIRHNFDPFKQTLFRLIMFILSGHPIDKIEIIIKGGTFSHYPKTYRNRFIKRIFDACNSDVLSYIQNGCFSETRSTASKNISTAQKANESSSIRIIGINIETRPDSINSTEALFLRRLGVTHVELGVQMPCNAIYTKIRRGHTVMDVKKATLILRTYGFKIGYHIMPNLPGSSPHKDLKLLKHICTDVSFKPDHLKLYPTTITEHTILYNWYIKKLYKPYPIKKMIDIIVQFKSGIIPPWMRIGRLTRDITTTVMKPIQFKPNLREIIQHELNIQNKTCRCIRCREIRDQQTGDTLSFQMTEYSVENGAEYFLEFVNNHNKLLGFLRLYVPKSFSYKPLKDTAIVRELHVYGPVVPIGKKSKSKTQHNLIGRTLLHKAQLLTKKVGLLKLAVISGVGVRQYYQKQGYILSNTYMIKHITM